MSRNPENWMNAVIGPDTILADGEPLAVARKHINLVGATQEDDPDNDATNITIAGGGGGATPGGSTGSVQGNDGAGGLTGYATVLLGDGYVSIGSTPASFGGTRLAYSASGAYGVWARNSTDSDNVNLISLQEWLTVADTVKVGSGGYNIALHAGTARTIYGYADTYSFNDGSGNERLHFEPNELTFGVPAVDPSITVGTGAPASSEADGSIYLRKDGTPTTGIYTRQGGAWSAVGGGSTITGTDTHVMFFDGANNPAGDSGLTYDKVNDRLSVAGSVALGASPAAAGAIRLTNATSIYSKSSGGSDIGMMGLSSAGSPELYVGASNSGGDKASYVIIYPALSTYIFSNGSLKATYAGSGVQFGSGATDHGGGTQVIGIDNASVNPTTNPTGGGILYADAGAGKWRGSSGTVTTFGPADLDGFRATSGEGHCPACGTDFAMEWANDQYGGLTVCMRCLADELGDRPWIVRRKPKSGGM